jgi:hypothetical protein
VLLRSQRPHVAHHSPEGAADEAGLTDGPEDVRVRGGAAIVAEQKHLCDMSGPGRCQGLRRCGESVGSDSDEEWSDVGSACGDSWRGGKHWDTSLVMHLTPPPGYSREAGVVRHGTARCFGTSPTATRPLHCPALSGWGAARDTPARQALAVGRSRSPPCGTWPRTAMMHQRPPAAPRCRSRSAARCAPVCGLRERERVSGAAVRQLVAFQSRARESSSVYTQLACGHARPTSPIRKLLHRCRAPLG